MSLTTKIMGVVFIAFCAMSAGFGQANPKLEDYGELKGRWEGALTYADAPGLLKPARPTTNTFRIDVNDHFARIFTVREGKVTEFEREFKVQRLMTNAIISSIDSGRDEEGTWVETWLFVITQKDHDTLMVSWCRMVNNVNLPLSSDHSKFTIIATGELRRTNQ